MIRKNLGHIICNGGSIKDVQKEYPDFPSNPSVNDFMKIGYKESTARRYFYTIMKNTAHSSSQLSNSETSNESAIETLDEPESITVNESDSEMLDESMEETYTNNLLDSGFFISSKSANLNNILVDTSALGCSACTAVIDHAEIVTFIYSTLVEMDNISEDDRALLHNVKIYTKKILEDENKYFVSKFHQTGYVDNVLLAYLTCIPKQIRPTLLTSDSNLAAKARAFDCEYILFDKFMYKQLNPKTVNNTIPIDNGITTTMPDNSVKDLDYGIKVIKNKNSIFVEYKGSYLLEIIRNGVHMKHNKEPFRVYKGDYLCLSVKKHGKIFKKHHKI